MLPFAHSRCDLLASGLIVGGFQSPARPVDARRTIGGLMVCAGSGAPCPMSNAPAGDQPPTPGFRIDYERTQAHVTDTDRCAISGV